LIDPIIPWEPSYLDKGTKLYKREVLRELQWWIQGGSRGSMVQGVLRVPRKPPRTSNKIAK